MYYVCASSVSCLGLVPAEHNTSPLPPPNSPTHWSHDISWERYCSFSWSSSSYQVSCVFKFTACDCLVLQAFLSTTHFRTYGGDVYASHESFAARDDDVVARLRPRRRTKPASSRTDSTWQPASPEPDSRSSHSIADDSRLPQVRVRDRSL